MWLFIFVFSCAWKAAWVPSFLLPSTSVVYLIQATFFIFGPLLWLRPVTYLEVHQWYEHHIDTVVDEWCHSSMPDSLIPLTPLLGTPTCKPARSREAFYSRRSASSFSESLSMSCFSLCSCLWSPIPWHVACALALCGQDFTYPSILFNLVWRWFVSQHCEGLEAKCLARAGELLFIKGSNQSNLCRFSRLLSSSERVRGDLWQR